MNTNILTRKEITSFVERYVLDYIKREYVLDYDKFSLYSAKTKTIIYRIVFKENTRKFIIIRLHVVPHHEDTVEIKLIEVASPIERNQVQSVIPSRDTDYINTLKSKVDKIEKLLFPKK